MENVQLPYKYSIMMQNYYISGNNPGDYLITNQIHTLATKLHTYFQSLVKIFNNDISNLIFQFFVLKLVNGIPFNAILFQLKIIFTGFYLKYIKRYYIKYSPHKLIFHIQCVQNKVHVGYGMTDLYSGTTRWNIERTQLALIWKINRNTKHIAELIKTDLTYVDGIKKCITTEVLIPSNIFWHKLDDDSNVFIDVYDDKLPDASTQGEVIRKYLVVKSNTLSLDELKNYVDDVIAEFNDFFANHFLQNQRIFIKSTSASPSKKQQQPIPMPYNENMCYGINHVSSELTPPTVSDGWKIENFCTNKTWDTFFIENKKQIRENMEGLFSINADEDKRVGRSTKKIILAHGPSRCGKNSLFKILTSQLDTKHLIYIQPGSIGNFTEFEAITKTDKICGITIPPEKRIYQLDEIDKSIHDLTTVDEDAIRRDVKKQFVKPRHTQNNIDIYSNIDSNIDNDIDIDEIVREKIEISLRQRDLELSKWLTYLDGAHEDNNKIIFMTAEHITKLRPSFLNRCRIIEVKKANRNAVKKIVTMYFKYDGLNDDINSSINKIEDYVHTPSDVYDECERNVTNFDKKINNYEMIQKTMDTLCNKQLSHSLKSNNP